MTEGTPKLRCEQAYLDIGRKDLAEAAVERFLAEYNQSIKMLETKLAQEVVSMQMSKDSALYGCSNKP